MKISKSVSRESAIRKAINQLNACLRNAKKKPILLMVSGGSALELLAGVEMRYMGRHVTVTVLDERYSKDPAVNNFSQLAETDFYKKAEYKGIDYIDTRVHHGIKLQGLARKFERGLRRWRKQHPKGNIIIMQGIGEDGHTAGIMSYPRDQKRFERLFENDPLDKAPLHEGRGSREQGKPYINWVFTLSETKWNRSVGADGLEPSTPAL